MCQGAKRTSRAGSPLSKNYIGPELHAIKSLQKIKKKMKFCPVEGSVAWYKNRYQESTEAPVVGSDLKEGEGLGLYTLLQVWGRLKFPLVHIIISTVMMYVLT